jgi:hypothetical protein
MIPFILVITLQDRKTLFCVFFSFRDLYGLKLIGDFSWTNILRKGAPGALEPRETSHEAQKSTGGAGPGPGHTTWPLLAVEHRQPSIQSPADCF